MLLRKKTLIGDITMAYVIFEVKKEQIGKINEMLKDDIVNRQSVLTRDAHALGIEKEVSYFKVEGSEDGLKRAEELAKEFEFKKLDEKDSKDVNQKILDEEDSAADGMGMIFG
jgi:hypothetical protein